MSNPLLENHELPPFRSILPEHVEPAIDHLLAESRRVVSESLASGNRDYHHLVRKIEEQDDRLAKAFAPVGHLNSVMNSPSLRSAYENCLPKLSEYGTEMRQNPRLFEAYSAIAESEGFVDLDQAERKSLKNALRDFRLTGIDLPAQDQKRFAEISKRLSELTNQFSNNVLDATMAWSKHVTNEKDLAGLPESALALAMQTAQQRGETGYMITLEFPSYLPVMTYCENQSLRQEAYEAYVTRASERGPYANQWDNSQVMGEILRLRHEQSRLLGYHNYAELSLATKMARTVEEVMSFLNQLASKAKPRAEQEFAEICDFARSEFGATEIHAWDMAFYAEKLRQNRFKLNDEEPRPYFPAPRVVSGMFEIVRRLFDIDVRQADDIETWHPDVTTYNIFKNEELIARFYLDLYARPNKQGGAWMDDCRVRRRTLSGDLQLPVAFLTCNFGPPVGGNPALLRHDDVVTLFHEFGHGLHHLLTRVESRDVSGIHGVAWDAVELPSQLLENWCWQAEALALTSGHYQTGDPLPDDLLEKMLAARNFQSAMGTVRQLEFALFDFRLHAEFDPSIENQAQQLIDEVRSGVAVVPVPDFNRFQHGFTHVFGGGYAAGYYSYKWAEVLSADAFAAFAQDGVFNRQTGERFLSTVLEQGGAVDAMALFVAFRGREPDIEALLRQDGIIG